MRNGEGRSVLRLKRAICVALALSSVAGIISGCEKTTVPISTGTSISQTEPTLTLSAPAGTESIQSDKPVTIGEMKEVQVPFGRVSENVGFFKLGLSDKDMPSYALKGQYAYCLSGVNGDYSYRRINIENLEKSGICEIKVKDGTAAMVDFGIRCDLKDQTIFYDFNLHEIYRTGRIGGETILIPYKDGYLLKDGNKLRILHLDDEKPFRTLRSTEYVIARYHSTEDNAYLLLKDRRIPDSKVCIVYDVNRNVYFNNIQDNAALSDVNMVRYSSGKYTISNFAKRKSAVFESKNPGIVGSCIFDSARMYFYDKADHKIKYYIPAKQKICVLSEAEFTNGATIKGLYGSYVYVQYGNTMYFIDSAGLTEQSGDAYIKKIKKDTAAFKKNLEFHYRIKILSGKEVLKPASKNVKADVITNDLELLTSMNKLAPALSKFNYKFFDEFKWNMKDGVSVLLTGNMVNTADNSSVEGLSFKGASSYYIAVNVRSGDIATTFCRELMHTIELRMTDSGQVFAEWNRFNPEGFTYSTLIAGAADAPFIPENETESSRVYFVDAYACASASEDRARLFAAIFVPENVGRNVKDYPNLLAKAGGLKHILLTYCPSLSEVAAMKEIS